MLTVVAIVIALASASAGDDPNLTFPIIPGERIGNSVLGMTAAGIARTNMASPCPVVARYRWGRAVRITTEWGVACQTRGGTQVGMWLSTMVREFGTPQDVIYDASYSDSDAVWAEFPTLGIGFRILVTREHTTLIQSIAVFPRQTAARR
jgi:hypothetical protein